MARVKKRGLDYFPMNTDFIHSRIVRRIMKHEGDAAVVVLLEALSYIYAGEGYYVLADRLFYEDLSASLYEKSTESVTHIIHLAVEYGLFDSALFAGYGILSSAEIQRQYLFSTKRRSVSELEPAYCLLTDNELTVLQPAKRAKESKSLADEPTEKNLFEDENVTLIPENVTSGTHSIAQNSIAQHNIAQHSVAENRKEHPPSESPR